MFGRLIRRGAPPRCRVGLGRWVVAGLLAVGLAGCSGGSRPAPPRSAGALLSDAKHALAAARTVRLTGSITQGGQRLTLDVRLVGATGGIGTVAFGGVVFDVERIGSVLYLRGDAAAYRRLGGATAAAALAGKWIKAPASSPGLGSFTAVTTLSTLEQVLVPTARLSRTRPTTIHGQRVIGVADGTDGTVLYVAATGPAYPVRLRKTTGSATGTIDFIDYNQQVSLTAPAAAIDASRLIGG